MRFESDEAVMRRALELARRGVGWVEPNPPVGAVIVDAERRPVAEGYHKQFGGPHAEIHALRAAGDRAAGATLFLTLEPCCHHGKTGPCTEAILSAGIARVVVGTEDPNPRVCGKGVRRLREAGIAVDVGILQEACRQLIAPFAKVVTTGLPWVHAKWAMTLDGFLAAATGHSQWISNPASREIVHRLRGRMDAILVGAETAAVDDPLLTARPPGPRKAARVVVSRSARLSFDSQLVKTAAEVPVLVTRCGEPSVDSVARLQDAGVEFLDIPAAPTPRHCEPDVAESVDLVELLREFGRRGMTNVLVEGGGRLLGGFWNAGLIDEVHLFVAPKILGGDGLSPLRGSGKDMIPEAADLEGITVENRKGDAYIHGIVKSGD